jgi:hypothetical protein
LTGCEFHINIVYFLNLDFYFKKKIDLKIKNKKPSGYLLGGESLSSRGRGG